MTEKATTPEFQLLASAANYIKGEFEKDSSAWTGSPFEWVLKMNYAAASCGVSELLVEQSELLHM